MSISYNAWPTTANVSETLAAAGITLRSGVDATHIGGKISAVTERIKHRTHRQFVTSSEDRYFDGNDSGEMQIDEYVTLGTVSQIGFIVTSSPLTLANVVEVSQYTYAKDRIQIYQGSYPAYSGLWVDRFPAGRSNILCSGFTWGYASAIPADLWEGARNAAAALLAAEAVGEEGKILAAWTEADVSETFLPTLPNDVLGWVTAFKELLNEYKRPSRVKSKRSTAPLI